MCGTIISVRMVAGLRATYQWEMLMCMLGKAKFTSSRLKRTNGQMFLSERKSRDYLRLKIAFPFPRNAIFPREMKGLGKWCFYGLYPSKPFGWHCCLKRYLVEHFVWLLTNSGSRSENCSQNWVLGMTWFVSAIARAAPKVAYSLQKRFSRKSVVPRLLISGSQ